MTSRTISLSQQIVCRAPKGGIEMDGIVYRGGQFLPPAVALEAEGLAPIAGGSPEADSARTPADLTDLTALADDQLADLAAQIAAEQERRKAAAAPDPIQVACDIAAGRASADPDAEGARIRGAHKDLNAKGRGPEWYRMVYRGGSWQYVSDERLPSGTYRASDRRATVYGEVYPGEILADHDRGKPVDQIWLAHARDAEGDALTECEFRRRRDGDLAITLPDGSEVVLSDPRRK